VAKYTGEPKPRIPRTEANRRKNTPLNLIFLAISNLGILYLEFTNLMQFQFN